MYGAACVHGHEDLGSKRSRGPSGSDLSTPARIRHTRTPMLRGHARRCLGGVPGLYPAGLRLRPPPSFPLPPRSSHQLSSPSIVSCFPVPFTPFFPFSSFSLFLRFLSYVLLFLLLFFLFSAVSSSARRAYMYIRGINSRSPRKNRGNVITTLSFARSCLLDPP